MTEGEEKYNGPSFPYAVGQSLFHCQILAIVSSLPKNRAISQSPNICEDVSVNSMILKMKSHNISCIWKGTYDLLPPCSAILDCSTL